MQETLFNVFYANHFCLYKLTKQIPDDKKEDNHPSEHPP
jgi:hypothetical protein